jgi:hypothetical protein
VPPATLRRAFVAFHLVLGLALLYMSARTAHHAHGEGNVHLFLLAVIEAGGAALFLFARTLRIGGGLLLATLAVAILHHALVGEFRADLLVYLAGTLFVVVHGPAPAPGRELPAA